MRREAKVPQLRLRKRRRKRKRKKRRRKRRKRNKCLTCQNQLIDDNSICRQTLLLQQKAISYNFKNRDYVRSRLYLKMTGNQTFEKKCKMREMSSPKKRKSQMKLHHKKKILLSIHLQ